MTFGETVVMKSIFSKLECLNIEFYQESLYQALRKVSEHLFYRYLWVAVSKAIIKIYLSHYLIKYACLFWVFLISASTNCKLVKIFCNSFLSKMTLSVNLVHAYFVKNAKKRTWFNSELFVTLYFNIVRYF